MNADLLAAADAICAAGRALAAGGLTPGTSGNISVRAGDGYLMTPTNAALGTLVRERLAVLDRDGRHVAGDPPTKEVPLHLALYAVRPHAQAIVHVHSTHAVALSCLRDVDPAGVLEPLTPYPIMRAGRVVLVPYARPGTDDIARSVAARGAESAALLLANHGPLFAGSSLDVAVAAIVEIEEAAKLQILLRGRDVRHLTPAQIAELGSGGKSGNAS